MNSFHHIFNKNLSSKLFIKFQPGNFDKDIAQCYSSSEDELYIPPLCLSEHNRAFFQAPNTLLHV